MMTVKQMLKGYDKQMSLKQYEKYTKTLVRKVRWGKHRKCSYPDCAITDLFSHLFNSQREIEEAIADRTYKKWTKLCEILAVQIVLDVEAWRRDSIK